jgi:hypothetical protein
VTGAGPARDYWEGPGLMLLIAGFLLPPLAGFVDLQISYTAVKWACENDGRTVLLLLPLGSLAVIAAGGGMAWSCWTKLRDGGREAGGRMVDRSYFLALAGLAMSALFGLLVLTTMAPRYFLSPCE